MSGETEQHVSGWTTDTLKSHLESLIAAHRREFDRAIADYQKHALIVRKADQEAIDKAFAAASELSKAHNDLLRKMEKLSETFATRESVDSALDQLVEGRREARVAEEKAMNTRFSRLENWQAKITGGLVVVGVVGVANFVRIWTG